MKLWSLPMKESMTVKSKNHQRDQLLLQTRNDVCDVDVKTMKDCVLKIEEESLLDEDDDEMTKRDPYSCLLCSVNTTDDEKRILRWKSCFVSR